MKNKTQCCQVLQMSALRNNFTFNDMDTKTTVGLYRDNERMQTKRSQCMSVYVTVNGGGHAPSILILMLPLCFSLSQSWKSSGLCGFGDLEQTSGRLCLAPLGRTYSVVSQALWGTRSQNLYTPSRSHKICPLPNYFGFPSHPKALSYTTNSGPDWRQKLSLLPSNRKASLNKDTLDKALTQK